MKLISITARNFKGSSFSLSLLDINFIVGTNFAGKTARTDAIRFLLLGYLPELGKTNVATFGLSSGREMVVEGTFDNGLTIRRRRYLQGDSVKAEDEVPKQIADAGQLAVMLNAETYFTLSDRERVAYVFANIPMGAEWTTSGIIDKVNTTLTERFNNDASVGKIIDTLEQLQGDGSPQAFVDTALAAMTQQLKDAKAYVTRMEGTIQGLSALRLADATSRPQAALQNDIIALTAEINGIRDKIATIKAQADSQAANARTRAQLERTIVELKKKADTLEANKAARAHVAICPEVTETEVFTAHNEHGKATSELDHIDRKRNDLEGHAQTTRGELAAINAQKICPCCGADGEGWKTKRISVLEAVIQSAEESIAELIERRKIGQEQVTTQLQHLVNLQTNRKAYLEMNKRLANLDALIKSAEGAAEQIKNAEATLATIPAEDGEITAKMAALQLDLTAATTKQKNLAAEEKAVIGRQQDLKRLAEAEQERDKTKVDMEAITVAGKRLREIQSEMVKEAFAPLLRTANGIFGLILKTPIAYHEGEIGTWRDGVWVTHKTFSGTEKALTYAAIQAALTSTSPIRITLLDELGRIHSENLPLLFDAIRFGIEHGAVDQFVGIDAGRSDKYSAMCDKKVSQLIEV